jgi:hypothetical protein
MALGVKGAVLGQSLSGCGRIQGRAGAARELRANDQTDQMPLKERVTHGVLLV